MMVSLGSKGGGLGEEWEVYQILSVLRHLQGEGLRLLKRPAVKEMGIE